MYDDGGFKNEKFNIGLSLVVLNIVSYYDFLRLFIPNLWHPETRAIMEAESPNRSVEALSGQSVEARIKKPHATNPAIRSSTNRHF
jgi:hypothetical protein